MRQIHFTVDSHLLRELGERLVGRQYIALAELVKNSFDADATRVDINIHSNSIEVSDNGSGMTERDFIDRWMRVGSTHKMEEEISPRFGRPLTGSKGIGRLAAQFLASELEVVSVPHASRVCAGAMPKELYAMVDWENAVQAGDVTQATAVYDLAEPVAKAYPFDTPHGTTVTLRKLKHGWTPREFEDLAREIWFLQPPFRLLQTQGKGRDNGLEVTLKTPDPAVVSRFETQMARILDLYTSRLVGKLLPYDKSNRGLTRKVVLSLELEGQVTPRHEYQVPVRGAEACLIDSLEFEIRIFTLKYRQPYGIRVDQAREYMRKWGGVHIYDAGFRIPYAGSDADWLNLEFDHAHRLTQSRLLPPELNVPLGLNHLPTNSRVLGIVRIDASKESRMAKPNGYYADQHLQMQVSRDRLVENEAFWQLRDAVRYALHYYSTRLAVLRLAEKASQRGSETPQSLVRGVWDVLDAHIEDIPKPVVTKLKVALERTIDTIREQSEWTKQQSGLLGAMATVGVTAMAFDHQLNQHLVILEGHVETLEQALQTNPAVEPLIGPLSARIKQWIRDARDTRRIFSPVTDEYSRNAVDRFQARRLVATMIENLRPVLRGIRVDHARVARRFRLPEASYPVWMAIFNNVFLNAANAMLDSKVKRISVMSFESGKRKGIRVYDTGIGIDLDEADELFEPLSRGLDISSERRALGYGGAGLGLAIIRMLATDIRADVRFIKPVTPFSTCFEISWSEK